MTSRLRFILLYPFEDFLSGLEKSLKKASAFNIGLIFISFGVSWWIYVPIHELGHAYGCILGGGSVSRLEISPLYGADILKEVFPFVSSGSEYAGQLTGFDTGGSDLIYLLTVFFPFLLTIFIGVPLLKSAARSSPLSASVKLGFGIPMAFAPFISFSGDYYEMGSIIFTRLASFLFPGFNADRLRSDDVFRLTDELFFKGNPYGMTDVTGVIVSFILGIILIYVTYFTGVLWNRALFRILHYKRPAQT
ncbi:MAG: hypothetical protein RIG61_09025 [Deltaproteobacteria bacterium]